MTIESCRFLGEARLAGVAFGRVLTLGRQSLWVSPERLVELAREAGAVSGSNQAARAGEALRSDERRFEAFLRLLGATEVLACDASPYEGAEVIHDLNQPIPADLAGQFDLVLDGGTLEHVFHFPTAISNCMKLLRVGGRLLLFTPANNYCGHGFYQFSPELFYRVLGPDNGFQIERLHAMVDTAGFSSLFGVKYAFPIRSRRFAVADPLSVGERVLLVNPSPTLLFVQARRVAAVEPFRAWPQQSDYVSQWQEGTSVHPLTQSSRGGRLIGWLRRRFSERFCRETLPRLAWFLDPLRQRRFLRAASFSNRRHYQPVSPPQL
ncbi:MAG: hypothetical protein IPM17_04150 [Verrucomicrobia bacterium]|nr:hypothetical protein [Verrucomicrobiota bacterium]